MTSFQYNHHHTHRRASIAATPAPYPVPHRNHAHHSGGPLPVSLHKEAHLSSSVPLLSREFVVRRISEGETGRLKEELKCEACGKGYKHISSLAKHLWEHTPEWNVTKKLLISKHQQVQLLEAASILCSMNDKESSPPSRRASIATFEPPSKPRFVSRSCSISTAFKNQATITEVEEGSKLSGYSKSGSAEADDSEAIKDDDSGKDEDSGAIEDEEEDGVIGRME